MFNVKISLWLFKRAKKLEELTGNLLVIPLPPLYVAASLVQVMKKFVATPIDF
jgi:hypothetical protein